MKKFISFVMAGAMVASLVPATAFAKGDVTATAKVVDAKDLKKDEKVVFDGEDGPELQLKVTGVDYQQGTSKLPELEVEVTLNNAEFKASDLAKLVQVRHDGQTSNSAIYAYDSTGGTGASVTAVGSASDDLSNVDGIADGGDVDTYIAKKSTWVAEMGPKGADLEAKLLDAGYKSLQSGGYRHDTAGQTIDGYAYPQTVTAAELASGFVVKTAKAVADLDIAANHVGYTYVTYTAATGGTDSVPTGKILVQAKDPDKDSVTFKLIGFLLKDDVIAIDLKSELTKSSVGTKATVSVDSKAVTANDLVYATIVDKGIKASVKKTIDIAEDEVAKLNSNGIKIESVIGDFVNGQEFELKLSKGFEFSKVTSNAPYTFGAIDDNTVTFTYSSAVADDEFTIKGDDIQIEATSAKSGAVATLTVKALTTKSIPSSISDTATVEVAKVVDYKVSLSVDKDEDLPVIYSGVNVDNDGITDDSDHLSLEVTAKESFPGAWSMRQGFNFNLPEGVYVTNVKNIDAENFYQDGKELDVVKPNGKDSSDAWEDAFAQAYKDGDHKNFEFKKRVFDDVNTNVTDNDPAELTFQLELVADPTFEGDVKLTLEGPLVEKQEVTIAKFVKPYTVKAEQNDVIIDYRNTEVKTPIVVTEAEEGLWEKGTTFRLSIEDDLLQFEDDPTFTIDKDSDLKLKDDKATKGTIQFAVKETSDKAASVTISDMKLFMSRSIPAGAYDLEISTDMNDAYDRQVLYAPDATTVAKWELSKDRPSETTTKKDSYVDDVCDYSDVVKAAFINVVTSGRDNDNLFTTKVVVPVGEAYLLAGEAKVELDAPAYISAAGYTMLPVRAISKALGVNTNNVLWNAETRTVTVMYAQRIITMTVGQKTIYVNGSAIPASAAPEIKDGRTFLPLRDLGTALGVTNVNWDAATKTATLN